MDKGSFIQGMMPFHMSEVHMKLREGSHDSVYQGQMVSHFLRSLQCHLPSAYESRTQQEPYSIPYLKTARNR